MKAALLYKHPYTPQAGAQVQLATHIKIASCD